MSAAKGPAPLAGARKAAAFLVSLDRAQQAQVLKSLDPRTLADITSAMRELGGAIETSQIDALWGEIARAAHTPAAPRPPRDDEMRALLDAALGKDKAKSVLDGIEDRRRSERPFSALEAQSDASVARALLRESNAVAALVLAHMPPDRSAGLLAAFDADRALDIVRRMAKLEPPPLETSTLVAKDLAAKAAALASMPAATVPATRYEKIAQILVRVPAGVDRTVLTGMEADDKDTANEIRERMFSWNDLAGIDKRGMQRILSSIETRTLAIALKGSVQAVEDSIFANLSTRVRAMVAEERETAGPMPMAEVELARKDILKNVRELIESGQITTQRGGGGGGAEMVT